MSQRELSRVGGTAGVAQTVSPRETVWRSGSGAGLVGILTEPLPGASAGLGAGIVFINAGVVHRVGPNRLYVNLARHLAGAGFTCLRFDLSGIGDSPHRADDLPADESAVAETSQAIDRLREVRGLQRFVLVGLCSGAVTAFRTALHDERVAGAVLLNPQGFDHDPEWNASVLSRTDAKRYVAKAMTDSSRWRRALTGQIDYRRLGGVLATRMSGWARTTTSATPSPVALRVADEFRTLAARGVHLLVVCSEGDSSVDYMEAILGADVARRPPAETMQMRVFPKTDHSLTLGASQRALFSLVDAWAPAVVR